MTQERCAKPGCGRPIESYNAEGGQLWRHTTSVGAVTLDHVAVPPVPLVQQPSALASWMVGDEAITLPGRERVTLVSKRGRHFDYGFNWVVRLSAPRPSDKADLVEFEVYEGNLLPLVDKPSTPPPSPQASEPVMDEVQVRLNGGPPCYALLGETMPDGRPKYCGRAERWVGHHGVASDHAFIAKPTDSGATGEFDGGIPQPHARSPEERADLFPRMELLSNRLCQTQSFILDALESAGLTVVPHNFITYPRLDDAMIERIAMTVYYAGSGGDEAYWRGSMDELSSAIRVAAKEPTND